MIKNSVLALATVAAFAGIAAPTLADDDTPSFDASYVQYQLQSKGVNADSVEKWGTYVRAFVTDADGRVSMHLFDEDTLTPVSP